MLVDVIIQIGGNLKKLRISKIFLRDQRFGKSQVLSWHGDNIVKKGLSVSSENMCWIS